MLRSPKLALRGKKTELILQSLLEALGPNATIWANKEDGKLGKIELTFPGSTSPKLTLMLSKKIGKTSAIFTRLYKILPIRRSKNPF